MAGTPEKLGSQLLRCTQAEMECKSSLERLLSNPTDSSAEIKHSFSAVRMFLRDNGDISIPSILADQLNFNGLKWGLIGGTLDCPSHLAIGGIPNSSYGNFMRAENASATIEVARYVENKGDKKARLVRPFLRVAGATKDFGAVATTYCNLGDRNLLTRLTISISNSEFDEEGKKTIAPLIPETIVPLSYHPWDAYSAAGLITSAMTEGKDWKSKSFYAFPFEFDLKSSNRPDVSHDLERLGLSDLGYYVKRESHLVKVGLEESAAKRRGVAPREITVPLYL